jgi:response regulator RpfG family c-di-GMP phosphodiesterase
MAANSPEYQIATALSEDVSLEGFEEVEALADQAGIDRQGDGWEPFVQLLGKLAKERPITWEHTRRVTAYVVGMTADEELDDLRLGAYGALGHDLGKLKVPKHTVETLESFTPQERAAYLPLIRTHVPEGFTMLMKAGFPFTAAVEAGHHGYQSDPCVVPLSELPIELAEDDINYIQDSTRFVAMADHFDRMITMRGDAMTADDRLAALRHNFSLPEDIDRIQWLEANKIV